MGRLEVAMKEIYATARARMGKAVEALESNLGVLRTGRANPGLLNKVNVEYYGASMGLSSLANITVPDARTLVVTPYDRTALGPIEKAIRESDLGLNPANKGDALYVTIPALTEERRRDLVKNARAYAEEARVAVRNARRDALEAVKKSEKEKTASADDAKRAEAEVQKITDEFIRTVETTLERKEGEILH
jgi:ribosome recycling factor